MSVLERTERAKKEELKALQDVADAISTASLYEYTVLALDLAAVLLRCARLLDVTIHQFINLENSAQMLEQFVRYVVDVAQFLERTLLLVARQQLYDRKMLLQLALDSCWHGFK